MTRSTTKQETAPTHQQVVSDDHQEATPTSTDDQVKETSCEDVKGEDVKGGGQEVTDGVGSEEVPASPSPSPSPLPANAEGATATTPDKVSITSCVREI